MINKPRKLSKQKQFTGLKSSGATVVLWPIEKLEDVTMALACYVADEGDKTMY